MSLGVLLIIIGLLLALLYSFALGVVLIIVGLILLVVPIRR